MNTRNPTHRFTLAILLAFAGLAFAQGGYGPYDPQDLGAAPQVVIHQGGHALTSAERTRIAFLYGPYDIADIAAFRPTERVTATAEVWATASPYEQRVMLRAIISTGPLAGVTLRGWTDNDDNWNRGFVHHYGIVDVAYGTEPASGELLVEVVFTDGPMAGSSARNWESLD